MLLPTRHSCLSHRYPLPAIPNKLTPFFLPRLLISSPPRLILVPPQGILDTLTRHVRLQTHTVRRTSCGRASRNGRRGNLLGRFSGGPGIFHDLCTSFLASAHECASNPFRQYAITLFFELCRSIASIYPSMPPLEAYRFAHFSTSLTSTPTRKAPESLHGPKVLLHAPSLQVCTQFTAQQLR